MKYGNFTAKDTFNSASAEKLSELKESIKVVGLEIADKPDKDGQAIRTASLKTDTGIIYTTVSPSALQQIDAMADMFEDGEKEFDIKVIHRTSGQGRDYIQLQLV